MKKMTEFVTKMASKADSVPEFLKNADQIKDHCFRKP
jgi:hypothetical protein